MSQVYKRHSFYRHTIRKVEEHSVELLPVDFVPPNAPKMLPGPQSQLDDLLAVAVEACDWITDQVEDALGLDVVRHLRTVIAQARSVASPKENT